MKTKVVIEKRMHFIDGDLIKDTEENRFIFVRSIGFLEIEVRDINTGEILHFDLSDKSFFFDDEFDPGQIAILEEIK